MKYEFFILTPCGVFHIKKYHSNNILTKLSKKILKKSCTRHILKKYLKNNIYINKRYLFISYFLYYDIKKEKICIL